MGVSIVWLFRENFSLKDGRLVQELPESVNEHFRRACQKPLLWAIRSIPARGKQTRLNWMPNWMLLLSWWNWSSVCKLIYDASQNAFSISRTNWTPHYWKEIQHFNQDGFSYPEKDHHFRSFMIPTQSKWSWMVKLSRWPFMKRLENPVYTTADEVDWS